MDWTGGYVADIGHTAHFYRETAPSHMAFAALSIGRSPGRAFKPTRMLEFDFGQGFGLALLATAKSRPIPVSDFGLSILVALFDGLGEYFSRAPRVALVQGDRVSSLEGRSQLIEDDDKAAAFLAKNMKPVLESDLEAAGHSRQLIW